MLDFSHKFSPTRVYLTWAGGPHAPAKLAMLPAWQGLRLHSTAALRALIFAHQARTRPSGSLVRPRPHSITRSASLAHNDITGGSKGEGPKARLPLGGTQVPLWRPGPEALASHAGPEGPVMAGAITVQGIRGVCFTNTPIR